MKKLNEVFCGHGDHAESRPAQAVAYVHVGLPTDCGAWEMSSKGIKYIRRPDGKPDYYHMAVCEKHLREGNWEKEGLLCNCPTPGEWPTKQQEEQCEINRYVPDIHCTEQATTMWGHGSIIKVCETHAKWNPFMVGQGECPDCGKLADHFPCTLVEDMPLSLGSRLAAMAL